MNSSSPFDSFGNFEIGTHNGEKVIIHYQYDSLAVYYLETLELVSKVTFQFPVVSLFVSNNPKEEALNFVIITEDQQAHSIFLDNAEFKVHSSTNIHENIMSHHTMLTDKFDYNYILFESGKMVKLSKKSPVQYQIEWPIKNGKIVRLERCHPFEDQYLIEKNSSAFIALIKTEKEYLVATYIYNFTTEELMQGPYTANISCFSRYLNSKIFFQNGKIFGFNPFREIAEIPDVTCASQAWNTEKTIIFTPEGIGYSVTADSFTEVLRLSNPPLRVESTGDFLIYLTSSGDLILNGTEHKVHIVAPIRLSEYKSILIQCDEDSIKTFPTISMPSIPTIQTKYEGKKVTGYNGATWECTNNIVAFAGCNSENSEFVIAASVKTVYILKVPSDSKAIQLIKEETMTSPIIDVAISPIHYAISTIKQGVHVTSYVGDPFNLTFHTGQCLCLSLSKTTVASGFDDGSFILASLEERGPIVNMKPFNTPVKKVTHITDDSVLVQWDLACAVVSRDKFQWCSLPKFNGAQISAFAADLLALGGPGGMSIYNFPSKKLVAVIPKRLIGICSSSVCFSTLSSLGIRFFALTADNELIVLYSHREIDVDHQSLIDADDARAICAVDESAYVICNKCVAIFDMRGNRIDTVDFPAPPRFFEASSRGFYVCFARMIWYISRDMSMKKIPFDKSNIVCFCAIDDDKFCIATSTRVLTCSAMGTKIVFQTLTKVDKRIISMKALSSSQISVPDTLAIVFEDSSTAIYQIPQQ
ncbi:hypothetical protein TVAG_415740 [Trichomonas vaginalis G3]|uniref:Uncharacterized protein n=1 Tax=Trichomonas vaginalis (strain ATCC PRA-98 / G3) TaxID=412133 RepID=A2FWW8_TRIV3|nr:WD40 repeat-like family [Trichomonas vaginalis G3]EAX90597.1 hypothetical protein TVAG_415740 [Trichomonas vaginalis G3]KAI5544689.1 WD40 repeat-like family [Trichomonas vaginalis G3]|eukprot:XP_001303527.1 hypothetical protein [Trichomonas vaginalis G3]